MAQILRIICILPREVLAKILYMNIQIRHHNMVILDIQRNHSFQPRTLGGSTESYFTFWPESTILLYNIFGIGIRQSDHIWGFILSDII